MSRPKLKIMRLKLENFLHIYSGLGKTLIDLDFSISKYDKLINIIIGKMGSCKSVILGHLQPFSGFGTLDSRNQDGIIIEGENGLKQIEYLYGENYYVIQHVYTWKAGKHSIKSFITKNDEQLNPNGNINSFKAIVEMELGIEPSDLSLLRLGPNVTNLIDMGSTERKAYIAARLKDTAIYANLFKKLTEEIRLLNARATVLTGKITSLTQGSVEEMQDEKSMIVEASVQTEMQLNALLQTIGEYGGTIRQLLDGMDEESFRKQQELYEKEYSDLGNSIKAKEREIEDIQSTYQSIHSVSENIGAIQSELSRNQRDIDSLNTKYKEFGVLLGKVQEKRLIIGDAEQLDNLRKTYSELLGSLDEMEMSLQDFKCKYAAPQLRALLAQLNTVNELISDISMYNHDTVIRIIKSDRGILAYASQQIDILTARRIKTQRELSNMKFADQYEPSEVLYFPPFCPTKDCPYYRTHPSVLREENNGIDKNDYYDQLQKDIDRYDHEIDVFSEYSIIYSKVAVLKEIWPPIAEQLAEIGALRTKSLVKIFSNIFDQKWYDYDRVVETLNLCATREKHYELSEKVQSMKVEIDAATRDDIDNIESQITQLQKEIDEVVTQIAELESRNKHLRKAKEQLDIAYERLVMIESAQAQLSEDKRRYHDLEVRYNDMNEALERVVHIKGKVKDALLKKATLTTTLQNQRERIEKLNIALNDISFSQKEFLEVQEAQGYLRDIVEAVSSNKGIPLVYVRLFLNQCRETVNDLISDVFGDSIEILDFNITETDFKIPYAINGNPVKDIAAASQGQRSIISLALSFALIRQSLSQYNIMLLDEMDGPLYKDDRDKFISLLFKQIQAIDAEQIFVVSHNNTFDGHNVNIIMTTDEHVDPSHQISIMHV